MSCPWKNPALGRPRNNEKPVRRLMATHPALQCPGLVLDGMDLGPPANLVEEDLPPRDQPADPVQGDLHLMEHYHVDVNLVVDKVTVIRAHMTETHDEVAVIRALRSLRNDQ